MNTVINIKTIDADREVEITKLALNWILPKESRDSNN